MAYAKHTPISAHTESIYVKSTPTHYPEYWIPDLWAQARLPHEDSILETVMLSMLRDCELHLCGCTTCAASTAKRRVDFFGHNRVACTDGLLSFRCLLRDVAVHLLC